MGSMIGGKGGRITEKKTGRFRRFYMRRIFRIAGGFGDDLSDGLTCDIGLGAESLDMGELWA